MTAAPLPRPADRIAQAEALTAGGFVLVPVPRGTKGPRETGWNSDPAQWITTPSAARAYLTAHPGAGVGLLHSESQTAALDIDHDGAALALAAVGVDLAALMAGNPYRVRGKKGEKPLYRVPDGLSLGRVALIWPDPSGKKGPGGRPAPQTILELRGWPVQDVMPPSIHPDTGQPYTWAGPVPERVADLPELPPELLSLWQRWRGLEGVMKAACPWAPGELPAPSERDLTRLGGAASRGEGGSVIDQFNASRSLGEVLGEHGYKGPPRGPWLYPHSSSGQAGVRLRPERTPAGAEVVMSWHAADPLGDGLPRDAFGVWALLSEGVDVYAATPEQRREVVKKAARVLGLPEPERGRAGAQASTARPVPAADLPPVAWGDVTPLPPLTEPVPPLPAELLPRPLADWIQAEARAAGLPLESVAAPVLAGASGLINRRLALRNVLSYPPVTGAAWCGICAPPGAKKSWAVSLGAAPLERAERAEFDRIAAERSTLEARRDMAEARLDALQTRMKAAYKSGKGELPSEDELAGARDELSAAQAALTPERFTVRDVTIERLAVLASQNPQGLMLIRDELVALIGTFEKPGRESDRAQWLELANGDAVLQVDRMSREALYVPGVAVGILGGIQPGPLARLLDGESLGGDGFLQRFQLFVWPDRWPEFDQAAQHEGASRELRGAAAALLDTLPSLTAEALGSTYPSGDGAPLAYTPEAQALFNAWEVGHEQHKRDLSRGEAYRSHISKQPGTFARLALIFHALDVAAAGVGGHPHPARVGLESAALAAMWCDYLGAHARKLWREGRRADVLDARAVLRFVERGRVCDGQKVADVRRVLSEAREALTGPRLEAALRVLEGCGAVRVEVSAPPGGKAGGRPVKTLRVHPDALAALDGAEGEVSA